jgi:hypothetical protein
MTKTVFVIASTMALALAACGDEGGAQRPAGPPRAVIVAGDFKMGDPGVLSTLDPATGVVAMNVGPALAVGADPILRHFGTELFIINRGENNITILDDQTLALVEQLGTGASSNPQDVAVLGTKLYLPTLGTTVTVLTRGSTATSQIDLSADDPDGKPDCNSVYLVGSDLYVSCGVLDETFAARGPGLVHVIDTATSRIKTTVMLSHRNPLGLFERIPGSGPQGGDLLMTTVEDFVTKAGCVERVTTGATPSVAACLVDNAMLGGYASRTDPEVDADGSIVWTAVATDYPKADLRAYDMTLAALWAGPLNPTTQAIGDVAHCPSGELVVVDSTTNANGLRIYNGTTEQTTAALPIGLGFFSQHGLVCY